MGWIPKEPSWCRYCEGPEEGYCEHHRGPDNSPRPYDGPDLYTPSEWVLEVVGEDYKGFDGNIYHCYGYDPRCGFWMRGKTIDRKMNISERAIGRTYKKVRKSWQN